MVAEASRRQEVEVEVDGVRGVDQHEGQLLTQVLDGVALGVAGRHAPAGVGHHEDADGEGKDDEHYRGRQQHQVHLKHARKRSSVFQAHVVRVSCDCTTV